MSAVRIQLDIDDQSLKVPLVWSVVFHALILSSLAISTLMSHSGDAWGGSGGGGEVSLKLVGSLSGVPLPRPDVVTTSRVVDPTKGLYKAEPKPKELPVAAEPIPQFNKEKQPRIVTRPSKTLEDTSTPPPNAVPFGQGGAPAVPYAQFTLGGNGGTANAGMGFSGAGGGDFGSRFSWYVDAVRNRVSSNWLQSTVDPSLSFAPRAVVTFDILRSGDVVNVQILQSSGNTSVNDSVIRAVKSSSPLTPLPNEYSGQKVSVEFWFDYKR